MSYTFDISVSDPSIEVSPDAFYKQFSKVKAIAPKRWRLMVPYSLVCTSLRAGPYQTGGKSVVTATITGSGYVGNRHGQTARATATGTGVVVGVGASQQGRDWHHVDDVISDIRLQVGCDVTLVIGQGFPAGSNAPFGTSSDFASFCVEAVQRYKPGGPGIRTDGKYASLAGWGCTQWEVWNEENNAAYWGYNVSAQNYTTLLRAAYPAIKSVLPGSQSTVIFGGMQHIPFQGIQWTAGFWTVDEFSFLQQCYSFGAQGYFDAMATHLYPTLDPATPAPPAPPNIISLQNIPFIQTSAYPKVTATAKGTGRVNLTPGQHGTLQCSATASGMGVLNPSEDPGPVPSLWMDNFRQIVGIRTLMVINGDAAKKIKITEGGYNVFSPGITPELQQLYMKQSFDILDSLGYIDEVHIYNTVDTTNSQAPSDTSGFGMIDYDGNPRPLYNWLLTLVATLPAGSGGQTVTAVAAGAGGIAGAGALTVTATAGGTGYRLAGGGVITATATGSGVISYAPSVATVVATIRGAGAKGFVSGGGTLNSGATLPVTARAVGFGKTGIVAAQNGTLLVSATAQGSGRASLASPARTLITAAATGSGTLGAIGQEIGVVGEVTGGVSTVTATATGVGALNAGSGGGTGVLLATATAQGAGVLGRIGAGASTVTATGLGSHVLGTVGSAALSITAVTDNTEQRNIFGAGMAVTVTAAGQGSGPNSLTGSGAPVFNATISGAGAVGEIGANSTTITAVPVGASAVGTRTGGTQTVTATAQGVGTMAATDGGTSTITAAETGAAIVGKVVGGTLTVTANGQGVGTMAATDSGTEAVTATATGVAAVGTRTGGTLTVTATATGVGAVGTSKGGAQTITATIAGAGAVGVVGGGSLTVMDVITGVSAGSFVTQDPVTGYLMLNGQRYRYGGANAANDIGSVGTGNNNAYGGVDQSGTYITPNAQVDALLTSAQSMKLNVIKATWSVHTASYPGSVEPTIGMTGAGDVFDDTALNPICYALSQATSRGIKFILPLAEGASSNWMSYVDATGGRSGYAGTPSGSDAFYSRTATIDAYKRHIAHVLNYVNPYTGIALKNDPNIIFWEIGNENVLGAGTALTDADYTAWADDIAHYIKVTLGANQLVMDGHYGPLDDTVMNSVYIDGFDQHCYDQWRTPTYLENQGAFCHSYGKSYHVGEFDWTDNPANPSLAHTNWTVDDQTDAWERSTNIDGATFWQILAPLTSFNDGYGLHADPPDTANMQSRRDILSDWSQRMVGITRKTFVSDDFTDTNGTTLSSHVGAVGATWDVNDGYTGVAAIQNNRLCWSSGGQALYYSSGVPASADYMVSADIYVASLAAGSWAGVSARGWTESDTSYTAYVYNNAGTIVCWLTWQAGDHAFSGFTSSATITTPTVGTTHNLKLRVRNIGTSTELALYWDDVWLVGGTDASPYIAAGRVGVYLGGSTSSTGFHIDKINAADLFYGSGALSVTATANGSGGSGIGTAAAVATAIGAGAVGLSGGGVLTVAASAAGSPPIPAPKKRPLVITQAIQRAATR